MGNCFNQEEIQNSSIKKINKIQSVISQSQQDTDERKMGLQQQINKGEIGTGQLVRVLLIQNVLLKNSKVICRDLNSENILVIGNLKLINLGLSKQYKLNNMKFFTVLNQKFFNVLGTLVYLALEIINNQGHNYIVDW